MFILVTLLICIYSGERTRATPVPPMIKTLDNKKIPADKQKTYTETYVDENGISRERTVVNTFSQKKLPDIKIEKFGMFNTNAGPANNVKVKKFAPKKKKTKKGEKDGASGNADDMADFDALLKSMGGG